MSTTPEITNSLVAYAAIAASSSDSASIYSAFSPFIVRAIEKSGQTLADPQQISNALLNLFGIKIPAKAVEGMLPGLCECGALKMDRIGERAIYELSSAPNKQPGISTDAPLSEQEVRNCISRVEEFVSKRLGENKITVSPETLSDRIRRALVDPKLIFEYENDAQAQTLTADSAIEFFTLEYVSIADANESADFEILLKITAGGMAVNFLEAFSAPSSSSDPHRAKVFFDTKILLDLFNFADGASYSYYSELSESLTASGLRVCAMKENLDETHEILTAVTAKIGEGVQVTGDVGRRLSRDGAAFKRAQVYLSNPDSYAKRVGIDVFDIKKDYASIVKNFPYQSEVDLIPDIRRMGFIRSREIDAAVIANIGRLLRRAARSTADLFSAPYIYVSPNTPFVEFAERILLEGQYTREGSAPGFIGENHFATALWLANGIGHLEIPKARLLSNCAALVSANTEIYDRVRNFLSEINEEDAKMYSATIEEDRSSLIVASKFIARPSAITAETSCEVLKEIKEEIRKIEEEKYKDLLAKKETEYTDEKEAAKSAHEKIEAELKETLGEVRKEFEKLQERFDRSESGRANLADEVHELNVAAKEQRDTYESRLVDERRNRWTILFFGLFAIIAFALTNEFSGLEWDFSEDIEVAGFNVSEGFVLTMLLILNLVFSLFSAYWLSKFFQK